MNIQPIVRLTQTYTLNFKIYFSFHYIYTIFLIYSCIHTTFMRFRILNNFMNETREPEESDGENRGRERLTYLKSNTKDTKVKNTILLTKRGKQNEIVLQVPTGC